MGKLIVLGLPGIMVSWIVTPIVLVGTFWFGQRVLKIESPSLNMTVSADMSVCGVSAAIATGAACRAKKEELSLAISLSLAFTAVMMVVMPLVIKAVGMDDLVGGAWMGGTIDSTGAVAAAGKALGDRALNVATTVKMIQNILIGVIAFAVSVYWAYRYPSEAKPLTHRVSVYSRKSGSDFRNSFSLHCGLDHCQSDRQQWNGGQRLSGAGYERHYQGVAQLVVLSGVCVHWAGDAPQDVRFIDARR